MKQMDRPIRIGISSCLLGENVRFDGGHKRDRFIKDVLGQYFEWVPVCPELEVGMGVPRESVRLEGSAADPRMLASQTRTDWTVRMKDYSVNRLQQLKAMDLEGYIFKSDSPSCGLQRVRIYSKSGVAPSRNGRGLFADAFTRTFPLIPAEEEGRLNDAKIRENFIVRVFSYHRWKSLVGSGSRRGALVDFHARHKYLLLAHSPRHYQSLGKMVGSARSYRPQKLIEEYGALFMEALSIHSTVRKNVNVLQHVLGFLKKQLSVGEKADILEAIRDYHSGLTPLVVPLTLLKHFIKKYEVRYILDQVYLDPHPKELMLRNHA